MALRFACGRFALVDAALNFARDIAAALGWPFLLRRGCLLKWVIACIGVSFLGLVVELLTTVVLVAHAFSMNKYIVSNLVLIFFAGSVSQAKVVAGAVSASLGNGGVGILEVSDGIFNNPAQLAAYPQKHFGVSNTGNQFQVHFADNGTDAFFPASIGYNQIKLPGDMEQKNFLLHLAQGFPERKLSYGLGIEYRTWKMKISETNFVQTVADLGVFYQPATWLSVGGTISDIALSDTDLADSLDKSVQSFIGVGIGNETFARFRFDVGSASNQNTSNLILRGGLQTLLNDWIMTSVGYENNNIIGTKTLTLGAGFSGPQFGVHYAYQKEANDVIEARHVVDLSVPF